jgi:hypothetical protein
MYAYHYTAAGPDRGILTRMIPNKNSQDEIRYELRVRELLDDKWSSYFLPFTLTAGNDETLLTGVVHDQAELFGLLLKIRDMGLKLVSVNPIEQQ